MVYMGCRPNKRYKVYAMEYSGCEGWYIVETILPFYSTKDEANAKAREMNSKHNGSRYYVEEV